MESLPELNPVQLSLPSQRIEGSGECELSIRAMNVAHCRPLRGQTRGRHLTLAPGVFRSNKLIVIMAEFKVLHHTRSI